MGQKHLEQMYNSALEIDCRAMALVIDLQRPYVEERKSFGRGFWAGVSPDVTMNCARVLNELEDQYYADIKQLMADRKISSLMYNPRTQKPVTVHDPKVIDFDTDTLTALEFFNAMGGVGVESCSGEQN